MAYWAVNVSDVLGHLISTEKLCLRNDYLLVVTQKELIPGLLMTVTMGFAQQGRKNYRDTLGIPSRKSASAMR